MIRTFTVACVFALTSGAGLARDADPFGTVHDQLQTAAIVLGFAEMSPIEDPFVTLMKEDDTEWVQIELLGGVPHAIIVVCDDDCGDVDVTLLDESGTPIDRDHDDGDTAVIEGVTPYTGSYTLGISLLDCDADPCAVAAAAFAR